MFGINKTVTGYSSTFWLLLLVYFSDDTLLFGTSGILAYMIVKYIIMAFVLVYFCSNKKIPSGIGLQMLILVSFLFTFQSLFTGMKIGYVYNVFLLLTALVYATNISEIKFRQDFRWIVYVLSIFSLVIYFIAQYIPSVLQLFPVISNVAHNYYYNCYVSIVPELIGLRNYGIFREPGAYMVYLNMAIYFEWFSDNPSKKRIVVYIITLITTFSTGGIIIGAFIILCGFVKKRKLSLSAAVIPILVLFYLYIFKDTDNIYYNLLFSKIEDNSGTTIARTSSITVPIVMFSENPLGVGPEAYNSMFPVLSQRMYGYPIEGDLSTNTFLKHLAVYGMFVFLFYFTCFFRYVKKVTDTNFGFVILFLVLLMALSNEDMRVSMVFNILIAYGISLKSTKNKRSLDIKI